ncbi:MAG TPA: hypothetical protein VK614_15340 [Allosphingosinicella sp.]|nr:hypothetical protein [Allosphingosinicella sp.]
MPEASLAIIALLAMAQPGLGRPDAFQPNVAATCARVVSEETFQRVRRRAAIDPVVNRVRIGRDGSIRWNGSLVNAATLGQYFELTTTMRPTPYLAVRVDRDADPARVALARHAIHRRAHCPPTEAWRSSDGRPF